jgi:general secretion pathway protein G
MYRKRNQRQRGFTLMELLVVLAILGLLVSLVGPQVLNQLGGAKSKTAKNSNSRSRASARNVQA